MSLYSDKDHYVIITELLTLCFQCTLGTKIIILEILLNTGPFSVRLLTQSYNGTLKDTSDKVHTFSSQ
jgi:hypothetical protein